MKRHEISKLSMRRILTLMEAHPTFDEPWRRYTGIKHPEPYVFTEVVLETGDALALLLRSKEWIGVELGCMFSSYYTVIRVTEIEVSITKRISRTAYDFDYTRTRKCLRLSEVSVA